MGKKLYDVYIIEGKSEHVFRDLRKKDLLNNFENLVNDDGKIFYQNKIIRSRDVTFLKIVNSNLPLAEEVKKERSKRKGGIDIVREGMKIFNPIGFMISEGMELLDNGYKEYILSKDDVTHLILSVAGDVNNGCSMKFEESEIHFMKNGIKDNRVDKVLNFMIAMAKKQSNMKDEKMLYVFLNRFTIIELRYPIFASIL